MIYNVITNILGGGRKISNIYIYLIYLILYIIIMIQGGGRNFFSTFDTDGRNEGRNEGMKE